MHRSSLFVGNVTGAQSPQATSPMSVPMSGTTDYDWGNSSLPSSIAPPKTGVPYIDKHEVRYGNTYGDAEEATFMTSATSSFFRLTDGCRLSIEEMAHSVLGCFVSLDVCLFMSVCLSSSFFLFGRKYLTSAVSYTHLTLPTKA